MNTTTEEIKIIACAYTYRVWNEKDLDAIDELLLNNCVIHSPMGHFHGQDAMKKIIKFWLKAFPDLKVKNISVICEKDLAVIHWHARGIHEGEFKGIPATGKNVSYEGVSIYRIKEKKISEYWAYLDLHHVIEQIS